MTYEDYLENARAYKKNWSLKRSTQKREWLNEYKKDKPCSHCGLLYEPICMDFHHVDPKTKKATISNLVNGSHTLKKLKEEVAKCEILCAICHRLHHYKETN
tara:strand:- start:13 stop:318 length:306 start_codon:yes stop_codon:yes gene_type:complete